MSTPGIETLSNYRESYANILSRRYTTEEFDELCFDFGTRSQILCYGANAEPEQELSLTKTYGYQRPSQCIGGS